MAITIEVDNESRIIIKSKRGHHVELTLGDNGSISFKQLGKIDDTVHLPFPTKPIKDGYYRGRPEIESDDPKPEARGWGPF